MQRLNAVPSVCNPSASLEKVGRRDRTLEVGGPASPVYAAEKQKKLFSDKVKGESHYLHRSVYAHTHTHTVCMHICTNTHALYENTQTVNTPRCISSDLNYASLHVKLETVYLQVQEA